MRRHTGKMPVPPGVRARICQVRAAVKTPAMLKRFALFPWLLLAATVFADPETDVREAVQALREQSGYAWETTPRIQETRRVNPGETGPPPRARTIAVRGESQAGGYTHITLPPSRTTVDVPVSAYIKSSTAAVGETPLGWMTRQEIRDAPATERDRTVTFGGKSLRLYRCLAAAARATDVQTPLEEMLVVLADIGSFEATRPGEIVGRLRPGATQMLAGVANARRGPGLEGLAIFRFRDGALVEFETRFESEAPATKSRAAGKNLTYWVTTFSAVGSTRVSPPASVVEKLERL